MKTFFSDPILFTLTDMKRLFIRHRRQIRLAAVIGGMVALCFLLLKAPKYKAEATFKQSGRQKELSINMKEMFQHFMEVPAESGTAAVMQSKEVIKEVVEELGMQVECAGGFLIFRALNRILDNIRIEWGSSLTDPDRFAFRDVQYSEEKPLSLLIKLTDRGSYQLYDQQKQFVSEGKVGERVAFPGGALRLGHVPKHAKPNQFYHLVVDPLVNTIERLQAKLKIASHPADKSILLLTFFCRDRFLGAAFLNRLMLSYQNFLKRENDDICQKQLSYLQKREEELVGYYDKALIEHAAYLNDNLAKNGFIGFEQEIETLSQPKNLYTSKLFDVDLELKRLPDSKEAQPLRSPVSSLLNEEISRVEQQRKEAVLLLQSAEKQEDIPPTPSLLKESKSAIAQLVKQIALSAAPQPHLAYLREYISQLEQKQRALEDDLKLQQGGLQEFAGLNLSTAQGLLVEYTRERDALQAQMRELVFLREQLGGSDFEVSSLGGICSDDVTRDLVNKASAIALQLKDENNRSTREHERLLEALQTQKHFLSHYLFQTVELKRLRVKLLGDKIASLQQATQTLLHAEKDLLKNKLQELNVKMGDLPEKWRRESLLLLKKELGAMMLEGVSQLVETKSLGQHTFQIGSRALDRSIPPKVPHPPRILLIVFFSTLLAGLGCYFLIFCKGLLQGLPLSFETLKLCGFPVSGKISPYCRTNLAQMREGDLETLRHMAAFFTSRQASIALCIGGNHPDFSFPLAELLAMRGLKVIVVHCVFDKVVRPEETPGLWQYLQGNTQEVPVRKCSSYDFLPSGGTSRHSLEILCAPKFKNLLSDLKQRYDLVLIYSSAEPTRVEGTSLLKLVDAAAIVIQHESREDLESYCNGADANATFVYAEDHGS